MKYQPQKHTGTPEERITSMLDECADICKDGMLRLHAKDREMNRLHEELKKLGVEFIEENERGVHGETMISAVSMNHRPGCKVNEPNGICDCPPIRTFSSYF